MRILLAEDEKELSNALVTILQRSGFSVDAVYDGADALDYLEADNYDGVILDIMMPKVDGLTVLKKLRERKNPIPVLMLTAKSEVDDRVLGLDSGANDYLTKPFAMKELIARLRAMTRKTEVGGDNQLTFGNITLDRSTFVLSTEAGQLRLMGKEFQMMELMMLNLNQLISAERFLERIWGYDTQAELSVVWVYISYLRRRLNTVGANVQIKSARNLGYTLEVKA
ncbi:response regulator MprA [Anaerotignum neopropionicum]|uniref:Stage 0 sporulation protein A homolog n=1 Tax=Anaerotignum neopropionicum TaxID=36847 RepID=A0A136WIA6_9FIRM|nr:response regulator transcription factor [Anaerotignum neopropionicum]KXL54173.1 response regulator MprA [Anaerotignum neopropionicum]KXL54298.1 response regulator MprA [Anaerotignum neopropionicum]